MTIAELALPVSAFGLTWWLLTNGRRTLGMQRLSIRGTLVVAFLGFETALVLITEILGRVELLTGPAILAAWLFVDVMLTTALVLTTGWSALSTQVRSPIHFGGWVRGQTLEVTLGIAALTVIVGVLAVTGWLYLPNNGDSLVYHLPRVMQWIQRASVDHFATHYTAQIELAPLHEFNMLHLHLITGADRLDGYVQLVAFVVCVLGAAEIARLLGGAAAVQVGAALIAAVIPSAVLEAASTQNNLFAAAVGVGLVLVLLACPPSGRWNAIAAALGLGVGLGVLAKGTLLPLLGPTLCLLGARLVYTATRDTGKAVVPRLAVALTLVASCAVLVAGPFVKRNHDLFGELTGPVSESTLNTELSARAGLGNVIRSVAVNFRFSGDTPVHEAARGTLRELYERLGPHPDDQRFTMGLDTSAFAPEDDPSFGRSEDFGGNPWHVLLVLGSCLALLVAAIRAGSSMRLAALLALGCVLGFVAFTASTRWSVFVSRYQLPLLVVWAPLIAITLDRIHRFALRGVVVLLAVAVVPQLLDNEARSLIDYRSRAQSDLHAYIRSPDDDPDFVGPAEYVAARDAIVESGCSRLGIGNWVLAEYPIWAGLENAGWSGEIEHVNVQNESAKLARDRFSPCAIIVEQDRAPSPRLPPDWVWQTFGELRVAFPARRAVGVD